MSSISISTHVLDTAAGLPVAGVPVALARLGDGGAWESLSSGSTTDGDGRIADLAAAASAPLTGGRYRIQFDLEGASGVAHGWYPEVSIVVDLAADSGHAHVPLLLAPYGYTTYRGS